MRDQRFNTLPELVCYDPGISSLFQRITPKPRLLQLGLIFYLFTDKFLFVQDQYGAMRGGRGTHLAPGIWAKTGTHGAVLRPVLMFVKAPSYNQRLSMERIAQASGAQVYLDERVRYRVRQAAGQ